MNTIHAAADTKPEYVVSICLILQENTPALEASISAISQSLQERFRYFEIVLIDNCTGLEMQVTLDELLSTIPNLRIARLSRPAEQEIAIVAGLERCIGDFVILLEFKAGPSTLIHEMMHSLRSHDIVIGYCKNRHFRGLQGFVHRVGNRVAGRLLHCDLDARTGSCYGFSRRAVNSLTQIAPQHRHIIYDTQVIGFKRTQINYTAPNRFSSVRSSSLSIALAYFRLIVAHSMAPLRMASLLAIFASALNVMYLAYIVIVAMIRHKLAEGWITTSLTHTTMFLLLFVVLALLVEYIERLLNETRQKPVYYVEFETHSANSTCARERLNIL